MRSTTECGAPEKKAQCSEQARVRVRGSIVCDNRDLSQLERLGPFDVIFAGHALCTCRWPTDVPAFASAAMDARRDGCSAADADAPCTCGGIALSRDGVDSFTRGVAGLLAPDGVALFDQEGGWPFGLETQLRSAAATHGLNLYVRRGPLWTNMNYVLSESPLVDDVSADPLQRAARALDASVFLFPLTVFAFFAAVKSGGAPREALPLFDAFKKAVALGLAARLVLPYAFDVLTLGDLVERLRGPFVETPDDSET